MPENLKTAMQDFRERAQAMAEGETATGTEAADSSTSSDEATDATGSDSPPKPGSDSPPASRDATGDAPNIDPDAADEDVLRFGRYVIEHFEPTEGDIFLIKGPRGEEAQKNRQKIQTALRRLFDDQGLDVCLTIEGPSDQLQITKIDEQVLRDFGYVYDPSASNQPQ